MQIVWKLAKDTMLILRDQQVRSIEEILIDVQNSVMEIYKFCPHSVSTVAEMPVKLQGDEKF